MSWKVEQITEPLVLGEGPHWDERQQALFFVCILGKTLHKYVLATKHYTKSAPLEGRVGFIVPLENTTDQFIVGVERTFMVVQWDGQDGSKVTMLKRIAEVDESQTNRINDGKADPRGRIFAGTMGVIDNKGVVEFQKGSLFRIDVSGIKTVESAISLSNGLAWDLKEKAFYYIDSPERKIRRYDYDVETGEISNMKHIFDLEANKINGFPDGMTIDTDGNLWLAVFGGSCVVKLDPRTGKVLQTIPIPALQVTSATFGGPKLDILFVTSATADHGFGEIKPSCGSTFMVTGLGVQGLAGVNYKY